MPQETIYIHLPRRSGKSTATMDYLNKMATSDRPVTVVKYERGQGWKFHTVFPVLDRDILSPYKMDRAERFLECVLKRND